MSLQSRLEREAEQKIALVEERAHSEAIVWVYSRCPVDNLI